MTIPRAVKMAGATAACAVALSMTHVARARGGEAGFPSFTLESLARGVSYPVQGVPQSTGLYGFGTACVDLDLDGDDDLVCIGRLNGQVGIYQNDGTGHFGDVSFNSGIFASLGASALASADLDGDRLPEVIITQINGPVRVYRNQGSMRFVAHALDGSFGTASNSKAISLADIDRDGDLDFFLANYALGNTPSPAERNRLLRNDGSALTDLAPMLGMHGPARSFLGVFSDIDLDGDQDLYVSNDRGHLAPFFAANQLWQNDGRGTFTDISAGSAAAVAMYSMGVASGDFDGNGAPDLLATNTASAEPPVFGVNPLLLGQGDGTFVRGEDAWQVGDFHSGWGALFADIDHNGHLDLFVNHQGTPNALWLNSGSAPATLVPVAGGAPGAASLWNYSTSASDLDRDGDLDLVALGLGSNILLYMNHAGDGVPSVRIRVEGAGRNTGAVGARVELVLGKRVQMREIQAGGVGYLGQCTLEAHFGLGGATAATGATVRFPDGAMRMVGPVPAGAYLVVHPGLLGDGDYDRALTDADRPICEACVAAGGTARAGGPCARFDFNGDLRLDADDLTRFDLALCRARSDLDASGQVDARDVTTLLDRWGTTNAQADLDGDGVVGGADLAVLLDCWG